MGQAEDARIATTEALFREVNERVAERAEEFSADEAEFVCECADPACTHRIAASLDEYEEVRAEGDLFLVVDGHEERPDVERVVAHEGRFNVVRKLRQLGVLVRRLNPRAEPAQ
ncbi:MAG: hypothetical protein QOE29_380 [Gaiellaceae bacterium]|nr:hypothetical protein [Gaiellaceae bacterium]